jgi:hypothetical protein
MDGPRYMHNRGDIMYAVSLYAVSLWARGTRAPPPERYASKAVRLGLPTA